MTRIYLYADEASQQVLADGSQKIITIGSDFGYGNFGDVLQHITAIKAIKTSGYKSISVMAANAINCQAFPSWVTAAYDTDAVVFVAEYPLILSDTDPKIRLVGEIRNVAGVFLYGGGFLNAMWGDYVLSVVEHFLRKSETIAYWISGQQITAPYEKRVMEHVKAFKPRLFGVRDELSLTLLADSGFDASYSFDDATETLLALNERIQLHPGKGLLLHLNSSDYTANQSLDDGLAKELSRLANCEASNNGVTVFQAFRDRRQDVFDSTETIKRLDSLFPFHACQLIDLVGLATDQSDMHSKTVIEGGFGYSCSYHVALWLQLSGIPCWLRSSNPFYDQKSRALQVTQNLEDFIGSPKPADHRINLERRALWNEQLQASLRALPATGNSLKFSHEGEGPAPWSFFYKGKPTLQEKLHDAQKSVQWHHERAEVAEHECGEQQGRIEALMMQLNEVVEREHGRVEALTAQLTTVGHEAHTQRARAEAAAHELATYTHQIHDLQGRMEAMSTQLNTILASRSWRFTRVLRVIGRLLRGQIAPLRDGLRRTLK